MNIEDELIEEEIIYASKIVNKYHLKKGIYNLQELCDELTKICFHAKFEVDKNKTKNNFEGTVKISSQQKLKTTQSLKYIISNRLAYKLGRWQWNIGKSPKKIEKIIFPPQKISPKAFRKNSFPLMKILRLRFTNLWLLPHLGLITSWSNLFAKGLENTTEFYLTKNSQDHAIEKQATLISHLTSLTISSNFLKNQSAISYFSFSKEQILQIMEDKLTLSHISQNDQNILHLPFYGMFCQFKGFYQNENVC